MFVNILFWMKFQLNVHLGYYFKGSFIILKDESEMKINERGNNAGIAERSKGLVIGYGYNGKFIIMVTAG